MNSSSPHFQPTPDGWFHIAPHGTFPHPNGALQVIDAEACEAMLGTFHEEARQPNFPGLLVDFDHSSHDPAQPTTAAGWIGALEHRGDGLYAQIRWSDLGHQARPAGGTGWRRRSGTAPIAISGPRPRPMAARSCICVRGGWTGSR